MDEQKESKVKKPFKWGNLFVYIAVVILAALLLNRFVLQKVEVDGSSMQETLHTNDQLFVEKVSYYFHDPKVYDIIVFRPFEKNPDTYYIKRVVGVPGDYIQIKDGKVFRNKEPLDDPQGEEYLYDAGIAKEEIKLGEDEYFVLGDNRYQSTDSRDRSVGLVKRNSIIGKAFFRVWPINTIGIID